MIDLILIGIHILAFSIGMYYGLFSFLLRATLWFVVFLVSIRLKHLPLFDEGIGNEVYSMIVFATSLTLLWSFGKNLIPTISQILEKLTSTIANRVIGAVLALAICFFITSLSLTSKTVYNIDEIKSSKIANIWHDLGVNIYTKYQPVIKENAGEVAKSGLKKLDELATPENIKKLKGVATQENIKKIDIPESMENTEDIRELIDMLHSK